MIEIAGLKKFYGKRLVLDVPKLTLETDRRYALIGPNGSGKSTLLRILAGVLVPDEGAAAIRGIPAGEVGYLPQKPYAYDLSVLQNVMLSLGGGKEARERALDALERVGLTSLSSARGSRLSGGEQQRMALARLIARPRRLLLLDEPTASVDIRANERIERALTDYVSENGCMLVFSSHEPGQALRLATDVVALSEGRVAETGGAGEVLRAPREASTQVFLQRWRI